MIEQPENEADDICFLVLDSSFKEHVKRVPRQENVLPSALALRQLV